MWWNWPGARVRSLTAGWKALILRPGWKHLRSAAYPQKNAQARVSQALLLPGDIWKPASPRTSCCARESGRSLAKPRQTAVMELVAIAGPATRKKGHRF